MIVLALSEARCGPYLLSGVAGMAGLVEDVAVYSALQRVIPPRLMGGALGVRRAGLLLSLGLGSPVVPSLATSGSLRHAGGRRRLLIVTARFVPSLNGMHRTLAREEFLAAVTGNPESVESADELVSARLRVG